MFTQLLYPTHGDFSGITGWWLRSRAIIMRSSYHVRKSKIKTESFIIIIIVTIPLSPKKNSAWVRVLVAGSLQEDQAHSDDDGLRGVFCRSVLRRERRAGARANAAAEDGREDRPISIPGECCHRWEGRWSPFLTAWVGVQRYCHHLFHSV